MSQHIAHSGAWGLALIMIAVASWLVYHYLAPRKWREWAGLGLVQAFIVALRAERYGFPLTIYLLMRFFRLDRRYLSANLFSSPSSARRPGAHAWHEHSTDESACLHLGPSRYKFPTSVFSAYRVLHRSCWVRVSLDRVWRNQREVRYVIHEMA